MSTAYYARIHARCVVGAVSGGREGRWNNVTRTKTMSETTAQQQTVVAEWDAQEARRLYEEGWSGPRLACRYRLGLQTLYNRLKKAGVQMRGPGGIPKEANEEKKCCKEGGEELKEIKVVAGEKPQGVQTLSEQDVVVMIKGGVVTLLTWKAMINIDAITGKVQF